MPCTNGPPCIRALKVMDSYPDAHDISPAELRCDWTMLLRRYQESEQSFETMRKRRAAGTRAPNPLITRIRQDNGL
ncbi:hypothetical protein TWF696_003748 [Orbilia brochopaga]|uniref:Uncharacterized protein n=1 Tax=Orbilia brochopaga TaxID=3140254 RepID=A0AAV9V468_9PEZI